MSRKFNRRGSGDSNFSGGHDGDFDLEQRNRETIKSNAERQAQEKLEMAKVSYQGGGLVIFCFKKIELIDFYFFFINYFWCTIS